MDTKITDGPWVFQKEPSAFFYHHVTTQDWSVPIAGMFGSDAQIVETGQLIALAPELLNFARKMDAHWTAEAPNGPNDASGRDLPWLHPDVPHLWRSCRALIAKAEGRDQ